MSNDRFREEFIEPIATTIDALTPGLAASTIGPPIRPTPPPPGLAASGIGTPIRPTPPPPPTWIEEYQPLIQFVDFYCGLVPRNEVTAKWPDPGPLLDDRASAAKRGTGLLLASAFLRRNAGHEWITADPVLALLRDAAARLSAHGQSLLG